MRQIDKPAVHRIEGRRRALEALDPASAEKRRTSLLYATGFLDSIGFVQYIIDADQTVVYVILLFMKLFIFMTSQWDFKALNPAWPFFATVIFGLFASSASNSVELIGVARIIISLLSITLTLMILNGNLKEYCLGLSINGFLISILYIAFYRAGLIEMAYDRSHFFGGSHPNLGGEILSMIVVMATLCLRPMQFSALFAVSAYSCWLMQSRTSILAMMIAAAFYGVFQVLKRYGNSRGLVILIIFSICLMFVLMIDELFGSQAFSNSINFISESVFLVENANRGAESGFSGRDDHWNDTVNVINEHFFFGAGIEFHKRMDILQPHSWFLYPVSLFGLVGYFTIAFMMFQIFKVAFSNKEEITRIIPILIMMALNDRFLNLNINPLAIYVYIFSRSYRPDTSQYKALKIRSHTRMPTDVKMRAKRLRGAARQPDVAAKILARRGVRPGVARPPRQGWPAE